MSKPSKNCPCRGCGATDCACENLPPSDGRCGCCGGECHCGPDCGCRPQCGCAHAQQTG